MRAAWLLVAALSLAGCKKAAEAPPAPVAAPVKPASPERDQAFWTWVAANVEGLKSVKDGHEPVTAQLTAELEKIEAGLVFELGVGREPFELIISADGKKELFPVVKRLVAAAPPIAGTKVIAFRPRKEIDGFSMQVKERQLSGKNLWFVAGEDPSRKGMMGVDVFVEGMRTENEEPLKSAAFLLLEAAVGEFDLETKIGAVEFKPAPGEPAPPLKPLKELPAALDAWK